MSVPIVVSCDRAWDDGRMPCRGAYPTTAPTLGHARLLAMRAGWRTSPADGDLCPAHTRRHLATGEAPAPR